MISVTVWNEYYHERAKEKVREIYKDGIHGCIKEFLEQDENIKVRTATLDMEECGLTDEVLENTDVLIWWGHMKHDEVPDEIAEKVKEHVLKGMGFIALHSAHKSKPFMKLMGTSCDLQWRNDDRERLWCCNPSHPIAKGLPSHIELPHEEMYGEHFSIPEPSEIVYLGWFAGGEVIRSGCTFKRQNGKIFYFQPGHEAYPTFKNVYIQKIITNAVYYVKPTYRVKELSCIHATNKLEN